jgi:N-acetyl-gamma-glutamylphosphate reductase
MKTIAIIGGRGYIGKQLHSVLTAAASARCSNQLKIVIGVCRNNMKLVYLIVAVQELQ